METLRIHHPRVLIHGARGMGQQYIGAAALHHLEGYHVQSIDMGTLMGDPTRVCTFSQLFYSIFLTISFQTVESALIQLFMEAKRHIPSILHIPNLLTLAQTVPLSTHRLIRAMLENILPTDSVLLLGLCDAPVDRLPKAVRRWFGVEQVTLD